MSFGTYAFKALVFLLQLPTFLPCFSLVKDYSCCCWHSKDSPHIEGIEGQIVGDDLRGSWHEGPDHLH